MVKTKKVKHAIIFVNYGSDLDDGHFGEIANNAFMWILCCLLCLDEHLADADTVLG